MPSVFCLGEAVMDLFAAPPGVALRDAQSFHPAPGGAPANVALGLARLQVDTAFIGRVGDDAFGHLLADLLAAEGVDTSNFRPLPGGLTTLALVAAASPNDQDFSFYRGADTLLSMPELSSNRLLR